MTMTMHIEPVTEEVTPSQPAQPVAHQRDRFGNSILDAPGRYGQYHIRTPFGVASVCGEADTTKHLLLWQYDAGERRYVCRLCFPSVGSVGSEETTQHV